MNKARRAKLTQAFNIICECLDEETEAFENLPESIQMSDRGERMAYDIEQLEEAKDALYDITVEYP